MQRRWVVQKKYLSVIPFYRVFDVGIDQKAVHLTVDILHGNLETVKATGLCYLNLFTESFHLQSQKKNLLTV